MRETNYSKLKCSISSASQISSICILYSILLRCLTLKPEADHLRGVKIHQPTNLIKAWAAMRGFLCKFSLAAWNTGTEGLVRKLLKLETTDAQSPTVPHHSSPLQQIWDIQPFIPPSHPWWCPFQSDKKFGQVCHCSCCCHETGTHHGTNEREWPLWFYQLFPLRNQNEQNSGYSPGNFVV